MSPPWAQLSLEELPEGRQTAQHSGKSALIAGSRHCRNSQQAPASPRGLPEHWAGELQCRTANGLLYVVRGTNAVLSGKVTQTVSFETHTVFYADCSDFYDFVSLGIQSRGLQIQTNETVYHAFISLNFFF